MTTVDYKRLVVTERLGHIDYELKSLMGSAHVAAMRVQEELIDKIPLKTWGNPPIVLSKPLTIEQVKIFFEHLEGISGEIANEVRELQLHLVKEGL